jgi:hypothetical protein
MSSLHSARTHLIRVRQNKDWVDFSKSIYSIRYDKGSLDFNGPDAATIMMNVTVRQLQIFCEAAQQLSFARVAERLHLSFAGVCFQIKQVESVTGFPLFERIGKRLALTDAGQELLVYATTVLRALDDADQNLMAIRGSSVGNVKVGLVSTAKYIVPGWTAFGMYCPTSSGISGWLVGKKGKVNYSSNGSRSMQATESFSSNLN